jgi:Cu(I)/Ag(I) efflux system membrane protein CusA/SilA
MIPMAIPMFGGMVIQVMTVFVVPMFQSMWREGAVAKRNKFAINNPNNQDDDENSGI